MLIWVAYTSTWANVDVCDPCYYQETFLGSTVLQNLGSVFMSMAFVTTTGNGDASTWSHVVLEAMLRSVGYASTECHGNVWGLCCSQEQYWCSWCELLLETMLRSVIFLVHWSYVHVHGLCTCRRPCWHLSIICITIMSISRICSGTQIYVDVLGSDCHMGPSWFPRPMPPICYVDVCGLCYQPQP